MSVANSNRTLKARERDTKVGGMPTAPKLIMITDEARAPFATSAVCALPRGSAVLFRDYTLSSRLETGKYILRICRRRGIRFLVAGDGHLAAKLRADGIHMPEPLVHHALVWRQWRPNWFITVAAHSAKALWQAKRAGADAALLSPVFATKSHPNARTLQSVKFAKMASRSPIPVYALGGINNSTAKRLFGAKLCGIAAVSALAPLL